MILNALSSDVHKYSTGGSMESPVAKHVFGENSVRFDGSTIRLTLFERAQNVTCGIIVFVGKPCRNSESEAVISVQEYATFVSDPALHVSNDARKNPTENVRGAKMCQKSIASGPNFLV